jgi:hypothetical protein
VDIIRLYVGDQDYGRQWAVEIALLGLSLSLIRHRRSKRKSVHLAWLHWPLIDKIWR